MKIGDLVRAISKQGFTIIVGTILNIQDETYEIEESDGSVRYVNTHHFEVKKL